MNGTANRMTTSRHTISQAFVFLLIGVFAVLSTLVLLLGAQLYRGIVKDTEAHGSRRLLQSYISNVVRGNDTEKTISVEKRVGVDMLVMGWDVDDERYETMVYCHDGSLRELFMSAGQDFELDYGEVICEARAFVPELDGDLLRISLMDASGQESVMNIALHCSQEGGDE